MSFGRESRKEENNLKKRGFFFRSSLNHFEKKKKKEMRMERLKERKRTHHFDDTITTIFERYDTRISTASSKDTVRECVSRECGGKELEREPLSYSFFFLFFSKKK